MADQPPLWDGEGVDPWLPSRLAAQAAIAEAEAALYNTWWASFSSWIVGVNRAVLRSGQIDPHAVWGQAPKWQAEVTAIVNGPIRSTVGLSYDTLFGEGYEFDSRPAVVEHLAGVTNRMVRTPDQVFDLVAQTVARGAGQGDSIPAVAERVDEILTTTGTEQWQGRAITVARTETISALNSGRSDSFSALAQALGDPDFEQQWLCVAGDVPVTAMAAVVAARRHYKGPLIQLRTAAGRRLALTPEHRVLTEHGWIPAHAVSQGDNLLQIIGIESAGTPQVQHVPASAGELIDAAMTTEPVKVWTMPGPVDLDSEAVNGEIQVVPVDRYLSARLQSGVPQGSECLFLTHADDLRPVAMLAGSDPFSDLLRDGDTEPGGPVRGPTALFDSQSLGVSLSRADLAGSAPVSKVNPRLAEDARRSRHGAAVPCPQLSDAKTGQVIPGKGAMVEVVAAPRRNAELLRRPRLFESPRPFEPAARSLLLVEQDSSSSQPPPDGRVAYWSGRSNLRGAFPGQVTADHLIHVQVPDGPVGSPFTAVVNEDRDHSLPAHSQRAGDSGHLLTRIEPAEDFRSQSVFAGAVLAGAGLVPDGDASLGEQPPQRVRCGAELDPELVDGHPALVAPDQVLDVEVLAWDAHVYDLSTLAGWYAADGLIVHNSTIDSRTRPDHVEADLQRVPLGQPFTVCGEHLRYPGDPAGSARCVVACRCTVLLVRPGEDVDLSGRQFVDWSTWEQ